MHCVSGGCGLPLCTQSAEQSSKFGGGGANGLKSLPQPSAKSATAATISRMAFMASLLSLNCRFPFIRRLSPVETDAVRRFTAPGQCSKSVGG